MELLLEDDPVRLVRDEDVPEPVHAEAVERDVVHLEVPVVVVLPRPGEVVVRGPAGRDHDVDEPPLHEGPEDSPHAGRDEGCGEGEERDALRIAEHRPEDIDADGELLP